MLVLALQFSKNATHPSHINTHTRVNVGKARAGSRKTSSLKTEEKTKSEAQTSTGGQALRPTMTNA